MSFKIEGLDKFQNQLKKIEKGVKELSGTHKVSFDKIFTTSFMKKYTNFATIDELLTSGGFNAETNEEFEAIPEDELDKHIAAKTKFDCWNDMHEEAVNQYISRKLGF